MLAKALPWMSLLYLIAPIDLIPDVLPILGQLDDVTIIVMFCLWALKMIPEDVRRDALRRKDVIDVEGR